MLSLEVRFESPRRTQDVCGIINMNSCAELFRWTRRQGRISLCGVKLTMQDVGILAKLRIAEDRTKFRQEDKETPTSERFISYQIQLPTGITLVLCKMHTQVYNVTQKMFRSSQLGHTLTVTAEVERKNGPFYRQSHKSNGI